MIFKQLLPFIWRIFDLMCYLAALITINWAMFSLNEIAGGVTLAISFAVTGLVTEMIANSTLKGGD
ncbi:DUF1056 family protein [Leuconostoc mesenteroides]|uniref:DUF1056 family protein n=1 Tax=Leuconostoc mesenteroides TaxID=1245 RepID=UPI000680976E|nr:DUF1056 family protein [Leuconostoc mesenteroides]KMY77166.1 head-tail joining protein [Leuconostoc mesenteroides subsp. mesenteroides]MBZ1522416.1 DUF1056 family protein [Leuconostoc mesenteroides]TDV88505.1 uncharacterized protein DUF1056 [Leuconostoc mesenteroides]